MLPPPLGNLLMSNPDLADALAQDIRALSLQSNQEDQPHGN